ncbi:transposable element Tc3 transposase [Trichonephila clavipes]|nr:transposable element Tc3 transposase [Trichonephila clavipes]
MVDFHKRILFSDEAHFWLNGYVNKQNCRNWSEANPQVYVETPLHPEKLTVWCALWAGGIIGPYFFKNDEGHNGYVKSLVYADKLQTLDHLEDHIRRVIADIRPQMLEKVIENWTSRLDYIRASRGSPMPEIIFEIYVDEQYQRNQKGNKDWFADYPEIFSERNLLGLEKTLTITGLYQVLFYLHSIGKQVGIRKELKAGKR